VPSAKKKEGEGVSNNFSMLERRLLRIGERGGRKSQKIQGWRKGVNALDQDFNRERGGGGGLGEEGGEELTYLRESGIRDVYQRKRGSKEKSTW